MRLCHSDAVSLHLRRRSRICNRGHQRCQQHCHQWNYRRTQLHKENSTENSELVIHSKVNFLFTRYAINLDSKLRTAVAQRIELLVDSRDCRRFESYQRYAHKVALQFVAQGYFYLLHRVTYLLLEPSVNPAHSPEQLTST